MKHLAFILLLITILGCKQNSKSEFIALKSDKSSKRERTELDKNILKYVKYKSDVLALINATVFDGKGNPANENQTLIIVNGYFQAIVKKSEIDLPKGATIIDLKGKTIIPGIVGVHNHLHIPRFPFVGETASKLYLASGVTTIQTCGSASPQQEIELSKRIEQGKFIGPNIITSGPYFTGKGGNPNMIIPRNENHIKDTIQYWTERGVRWFKVYRHTTPSDLKIIINEAHKRNAKVTGHLCSITFEQATNLGIDGIEHGLNSTSDFRKNKTMGICDGSREYMDELTINSKEVKQLQQLMIDNNVFLTSTLAIYEASVPNRAFAEERTLKVMSSFLKSQYRERRNDFDTQKSNDNIREKRLKRIMEFEHQFFKMGGTLTAGVDAGRHVVPGFGDQRNFELLKEAGLTTEEAIKVMTSNGAQILSKPEIGTIEKGKKADFVIIKGDVTENIRNVELVFKDGYGFDPKLILEEMDGKFGDE
ncbi:amidohydrolase family protein [Lacinutrix neustonica]|uniref:Amidohydrolase family protein n=1 Tax=Lacinutrix neustonica TaxID=2980107 RepID=A0A9E8SED2_9FLAO|nr:amidohydrolase family protein [Lacinutrix neustonica]WAC03081.1 amidohydrolase family protein [Lacinutrix neustonica]